MLLGQELKFKNKLCNLKLGTFFSALPGLRASAFYLSLQPVTVGSGRAVGELLDLLGVPTVQVETYCSIQVITHYCLGNRVVAFDPEKTEYTQTKKTFAFLFF